MRRLLLPLLACTALAAGCGSDDETASEAAGKTTPAGTGAAPTPPLPDDAPTD